jgi:DNA repair protein RecO (recombination protein O)
MEWTDEAVILGVRRHGESSVILEALTHGHGRHLGLVRGGRSSRMRAALQPGNGVTLTWRARLDEHLGQFAVEPGTMRAGALLGNAASLYGLGHLAALIRLLPERDPHQGLYEAMLVVLDHLDTPRIAAPLMVRFELALLAELGFGLDLSVCAVTGATQELVHVSPKSGRAVSAKAGEPYADRLLPLPAFVRDGFLGDSISLEQMREGFGLTGHFLRRDVYDPRGLTMPDERTAFITAALK